MKKTLHGRRHVRARKSAERGRAQRRDKRALRMAYELGLVVRNLPEVLAGAVRGAKKMEEALFNAIDVARNVLDEIDRNIEINPMQ